MRFKEKLDAITEFENKIRDIADRNRLFSGVSAKEVQDAATSFFKFVALFPHLKERREYNQIKDALRILCTRGGRDKYFRERVLLP